jgi:hypothetical protein
MATIEVTVTRSDSFTAEFTEADIAEIANEVDAAILDRVSAAAGRRVGPSVSVNFNTVRAAVAAEIVKRAKEGGQ